MSRNGRGERYGRPAAAGDRPAAGPPAAKRDGGRSERAATARPVARPDKKPPRPSDTRGGPRREGRKPPSSGAVRGSAERSGGPPRNGAERSSGPERTGGAERGGYRRSAGDDTVRLYGVHAVAAAFANPDRTITKARLSPPNMERFAEACAARELVPQPTEAAEIDKLLPRDAVHQGVMVEAEPLTVLDVSELDPAQLPSGRRALVIVLDQVTDPHNVGAILRSAAAFGADALIMTARHSPPLDGVLAKAASGGLEAVRVVPVANLARALEKLGEMGYFRLGLDGAATSDIADEAADTPTVLVLGAESAGMRRLTTEHCDRLCRIGTTGALGSLNVSNAAAIALHTLRVRQRSFTQL
jgi:23S rRNA (guanosine2251-2'-O)-methyltransferase